VGDRHLAEDIVQDAFVRVAGRLWALRNPGAFNAYLRQTVLNLVRGHMHKKEGERRYLDQWADSGRGPQEDPPDSAVRDELDRALCRLTMRQRTALVLRHYEDLSSVRRRSSSDVPSVASSHSWPEVSWGVGGGP
jgi:RNA polymerase sigma factor (sigma-70 family)